MSYSLEERTCQCPAQCGLKFRVLPSSPCKYYSSSHDPNWKPKPVDQQVLAKMKRESKKYYGDTFGGSELIEEKEDLTLTDIDEKDPQL